MQHGKIIGKNVTRVKIYVAFLQLMHSWENRFCIRIIILTHAYMHMDDISGVIGVQSESITFATKRFSECSHIMIYIDWTTTIYNTIRFVCLDLCKLTDDKKKLHTNQIPIKLRYALNVVKWTKISRSCATRWQNKSFIAFHFKIFVIRTILVSVFHREQIFCAIQVEWFNYFMTISIYFKAIFGVFSPFFPYDIYWKLHMVFIEWFEVQYRGIKIKENTCIKFKTSWHSPSLDESWSYRSIYDEFDYLFYDFIKSRSK